MAALLKLFPYGMCVLVALPLIYALTTFPITQQQVDERLRWESQQRLEEKYRSDAALEARRKNAQTINCTLPKTGPVYLTKEWSRLNPHGCAFIWDVVEGKIEFQDQIGNVFTVDGVGQNIRGKTAYAVRASSDSAVINYRLCPIGYPPEDSGWACKHRSPAEEVRRQIFGR